MTSRSDDQPIHSFGPFRVDFASCEIVKHGVRLHVQNQPVRVLQLLIERPGQLVTRQELIDNLWPGHSAEESDDSLNSTVKKLRDALCDDAGRPLYIETVPRRGYRFIAAVQVLVPEGSDLGTQESATSPVFPAADSHPPQATRPAAPFVWDSGRIAALAAVLVLCLGAAALLVLKSPKRAEADSQVNFIAVLPFENLSGDSSQEYFAEGLSDAVTTELAQMGTVKVISRASTSHYKQDHKPLKQIHQELGVDAVVEGTLSRSGDRVRVTARLISTGDDRILWAQSFDRDAGDILVLEEDLAQSVAHRIQAAISPPERVRLNEFRPVSIQAYEAFLRGMHDLNYHRTNAELQKSLEQFDQAIALDPKLAEAYAGKSSAYNLLADYDAMPSNEASPKAEAAARQALALDPDLASAHSALGFALWKYDWDWKNAEAEFQRALVLNPNSAHTHHIYAVLLACRGDFAAAEEHLQKAKTLDPLSLIIRTNLAWFRYFQHDYAHAEEAFLEVLKLDPSFLPARQKLWIAYAEDGKPLLAADELENVMRLFGHQKLLNSMAKAQPSARFTTAVKSYIDSGMLSDYERARYEAVLGDHQAAVRSLTRAAAQRNSWLIYLGIEPVFDTLRNSPDFLELERRANIPQSLPPK